MSISITRKELEKLYREHPNQYVCDFLKITKPTLISLLKKNNISLKGKGNRLGFPKVNIV